MTSMNDPLVGHVLDGRYEITSRIARGGMATVYVAQDTRLTRTVAVKVMHEGLGDDRDFTRKFDREARAAARLIHPNVVAVFDQGSDHGRPYIVMEYVKGQTLRNVISRDAPLTPQRALDLMEPVLAALATAHENGYVHRDVKPENVLISERGQVKVADFGLAKAITGDTVTATQGLLIGTVSYIPPEVVSDGSADARSDVYSAGVVFFELLTGRKPHTGDTPIQVAYAHCNKDIPAPSTVADRDWRTDPDAIPPYVDALVLAATARDPDARIPDARAFLERLRSARAALARGVTDDGRLAAEMGSRASAPANRWVAKPRQRAVPSTPVSPVDLAGADGIAFYDDLPVVACTPVERSLRVPRVVAAPRPRRAPQPPRTGSTPLGRRNRRRGLMTLLLALLLVAGAGYGTWYAFAGQFTDVPALTGLNRDAAFAAAQASKLTVTFADEFSEDVAAGLVIRTEPGDGARVKAGGSVEAFLSRGPERFAVPTLVGLEQSLAEEAVRGAGLSVGTVSKEYDEEAAAGIVAASSAAAGAQLKRDATVDLVVSKGPAPIDVVSQVDKQVAAARANLTKAGLKVEIVEEHSKSYLVGVVMKQSPDSGQLHRGDAVTLTVSKGPVLVTVPNTRGEQQAAAQELLEKAGFKVVVEQIPNPEPFGTVSFSTPTGGEPVPEGSTVTLHVA